jgi:hypothetical protein
MGKMHHFVDSLLMLVPFILLVSVAQVFLTFIEVIGETFCSP